MEVGQGWGGRKKGKEEALGKEPQGCSKSLRLNQILSFHQKRLGDLVPTKETLFDMLFP